MNLADLISNVGFPIACCVALGWYVLKRDAKHSAEIAELKKSVDNNTRITAANTQATAALLDYLKEREKSG